MNRRKKQIVFIKQNPQIRIYKQARALAEGGDYELVLVADRYSPEMFTKVFDRIIDYGECALHQRLLGALRRRLGLPNRDAHRLSRICGGMAPWLFHAHAEPNLIPETVMRSARRPVVFDAYDFSGVRKGIENLDTAERRAEKNCLEGCDGVVRKGPRAELDYYRRQGYRVEAPELRWMDYCDPDLLMDLETQKISHSTGERHLVYIGVISFDASAPWCHYIPLAQRLARQRIHLHVYPNPYQYDSDEASCYKEFDRSEPFFHFHEPVPYHRLSREIAKYDWGIFDASILIRPDRHANYTYQHWGRFSIGNKLFSYIEAGLPIIVSSILETYSAVILDNGIGVAVDGCGIDRLEEILDRTDGDRLKSNIATAREKFLLPKRVADLETFYQQVENHASRSGRNLLQDGEAPL